MEPVPNDKDGERAENVEADQSVTLEVQDIKLGHTAEVKQIGEKCA